MPGGMPALAQRAAYDDVTIVVPTYNEAASIQDFLRAAAAAAPGARVIVADEDSADGTRDLAEDFPGDLEIHVLHRRIPGDRGLTASVADALMLAKTPYVVVMDADLQHPAEALPRLVRALEPGFDVAVATRRDDRAMGWRRRLVSRVARRMARRYLRRRTGIVAADPMSGFFAARTDVAQRIVRERGGSFERSGFKVLLDLLLHAPPGLRVTEVEYDFWPRAAGESKLARRHYVSFLRQLGGSGRAAANLLDLVLTGILPRFLAVGATGVVVNEFCLYSMHEALGLPLLGAALLAIEASVLWNFAWNESWTFRGRGGRSVARRLGLFHVASVVGMALNLAVVGLGAWLFPHVSYLLTNLVGIAVGSGANFAINLRWTWGVPVGK